MVALHDVYLTPSRLLAAAEGDAGGLSALLSGSLSLGPHQAATAKVGCNFCVFSKGAHTQGSILTDQTPQTPQW